MGFKEYPIIQKENQPSRKHFSDSQHFDLIVWYSEHTFKSIIGFQLGFKKKPFDTDNEQFITLKPGSDQIMFGKSIQESRDVPTPKKIITTKNFIDNELKVQLINKIIELPPEISWYLKKYIFKEI